MKLLNKLTILACLFIGALASCESPDLAEGRTDQVNGLLNVTIKIPGNPAEYSATKKGPYEENEEITVKVPTTDDAPLDLTSFDVYSESGTQLLYGKIHLRAKQISPILLFVTVIDANGNKHHNTIRILPTPPKTRFSKLWDKKCR